MQLVLGYLSRFRNGSVWQHRNNVHDPPIITYYPLTANCANTFQWSIQNVLTPDAGWKVPRLYITYPQLLREILSKSPYQVVADHGSWIISPMVCNYSYAE